MSDDEQPPQRMNRRSSKEMDSAQVEASPGEAYMIFIDMNTLANKLKLLNYEDEYLLRWKMKPLSKYFPFPWLSPILIYFKSFLSL